MLKDEIYNAYENMGPDEAAKKRMLENICSAALQKEIGFSPCGRSGGRVPFDRYGCLCSLSF